jgi:predicted metal-dependent hydrolase
MIDGNFNSLHAKAIKGILLFNQKEYFEAHEELEIAWREETNKVRELYQGILQVGVAYYHIQRRNFAGGKIMLERSAKWLAPFPNMIYGMNIQKLKSDSDLVYKVLMQLGPEKIANFNPILFNPIEIHGEEK